MHSLDLAIETYTAASRTPGLIEYTYLLSVLFDVTVASVILTLCFAGLIYLVRGLRYTFLFLSAMLAGAIGVYVLKILFNVQRPTDAVYQVFGQSFPSYHATIATIFFVMLMYVFDDYLNSVGRIVFNTLCIISIFLVAASRVYLGVHWSSDVLGGIIFGVLVSYVSIVTFRHTHAVKKL